MKKPILIELAGLPGAGKTTVEHKLVEKLKQENINYIDIQGLRGKCRRNLPKHKKYWGYLLVLLRNLDLVLYLYIFAFYIRPLNKDSFLLVKQFFFTLQLINYKKRNMYDVIILDQGIVNNIWSIIISGDRFNSKLLRTIIQKAMDKKAIERLVFMKIDIKTAAKRIMNRETKNSRLDRMDNNSIERVLYKNSGFMDQIIMEASQGEEVNILEINAEEEITCKVKAIANWIKEAMETEKAFGRRNVSATGC